MSKNDLQVFNSAKNDFLLIYLYLAAGMGLLLAVFLYILPRH